MGHNRASRIFAADPAASGKDLSVLPLVSDAGLLSRPTQKYILGDWSHRTYRFVGGRSTWMYTADVDRNIVSTTLATSFSAARAALIPQDGGATAVRWINRAQEFLWLATVVLVPLAFFGRHYGEWSSIISSFELPKIVALRTLVGLMVGLWVIEWGIKGQLPFGVRFSRESLWALPGEWIGRLWGWLRRDPSGWLKLAVVLFLGSTLLSTVLSASFKVSMWGDVPGQDSYSAYTVVAYVLLFAVIATHLKSEAQLWRLLGAVVTVGVLVAGYAVFQHYGHDFLNLIEPPDTKRVSSTMGNATFAASVMLMAIPLTLAAATLSLKGSWKLAGTWWNLGLWLAILTVQLLGLTFTLSRGPWLGTAVALVGFLGFLAAFVSWRNLAKATAMLVLVIVLTGAIVSVTPQPGAQADTTTADVVTDRLSAVGNQSASGGLGGRIRIWKSSWQLIKHHRWYEFDSLSLAPLRPVIGYGPELFRAAHLLEARPNAAQRFLPNELAHAHNFFLHQGVELGFLGIVTSLGVFAAALIVGVYLLFLGRRSYSDVHKVLLAVLAATVAGRFVEQLVGVARVSDLTIFWVLLAMSAAMLAVIRTPTAVSEAQAASPSPTHRNPLRSRRGDPSINWLRIWRLILVAGLLVGIGALTWDKSLNYTRAAVQADAGAARFRNGEYLGALAHLDRAIDLVPDVSTYYERQAFVYRAYRNSDQMPQQLECDVPRSEAAQGECPANDTYLRNGQWVKQRPFDYRARLALADSAWELGQLRDDTGYTAEAVAFYLEAAGMVSNSWLMWNHLAQVYLQIGQLEAALALLDRSLAITGDSVHSEQAYLLRSRVYLDLDRPQIAIEELNKAVDLVPNNALLYQSRSTIYHELNRDHEAIYDLNRVIGLLPENAEAYYARGTIYDQQSQFDQAIDDFDRAIHLDRLFTLAYNNRGLTYARLGELALAVKDFDRAIHLDPELDLAYNNRGFVYRELGRLEESVQDLDQAILLNPRMALAYFNRALTNILLGNDDGASHDAARAVELGMDLKKMDEAIRITRQAR
jgi:tetratricopeptide (TPR) repeat protein/O-antigen ligase